VSVSDRLLNQHAHKSPETIDHLVFVGLVDNLCEGLMIFSTCKQI